VVRGSFHCALGALHRVDMGSVADVSKVHAASVFRATLTL
jgi:hypothetical protein